jgi:hypothetical protein
VKLEFAYETVVKFPLSIEYLTDKPSERVSHFLPSTKTEPVILSSLPKLIAV